MSVLTLHSRAEAPAFGCVSAIISSSDYGMINALSEDFSEIDGLIKKPFSPIDVLNKMAEIFDPYGNKGSHLCLGDDCKKKNFKNCAVFNRPGFNLNLQGA